ncbi:indolepyruvate ferredoxin oxidoreductase family protein [Gordonia sp. HY002]|uniref:indolepyruvate ferredoxin oxidoreductase family protein n=1 Tax=Gordonia zhenghanii TaxID=2911516 RepID=UPI001EF0C185|nr:indolepyruvate ferredoxin oxidoreductase family protein [Gordonia zhenghanii]MCF8570246.1 indolepyruvate ferredoxin oxidoreductase family protein [Gordonia zhenghanii]MCF8606841.1 indolepyruvate ferredoxin oxidoreductase family protein [Gordonia zhenghanii]
MTVADESARTHSDPGSSPAHFSLDDRYTRESGSIYLTGIQALVRVVRDRAAVDRRNGLRTGSFISGYEGSPLAGYDLEIARRAALLAPWDVTHRPGLNEEIGATSVMGSQLAAKVGTLSADASGAVRDGVVGYWYGKAPGLDRATDALRHANMIGTHPAGGAVALVGDDPGAKSSTVPCASEMALADLYMPILYPADSADILDFGVHAALMSRVSGLWTSLKISAHVADGASTAVVDLDRFAVDYGGLGTSPHVPSGRLLGASLMELEQNQLTTRLPRATEYARLNGLNRIVQSTGDDRIGIVAAGKTYLDVRESLRRIGIGDDDLGRLGIRVLKLGMVYPMERGILDRFIAGLDEVIVVEEKRDFIETMMRDILFRRTDAPAIVGKANEDGSTLFSRFGELDVDAVSHGLATRLASRHRVEPARRWMDRKNATRERILLPLAVRTPYFCSGCPHNSSTKVTPDTIVGAGIGCHAMVLLMEPEQVGDIAGVTQMGGEGAQWLGMAPFIDEKHFVQNIGDGTYMHSGSLAVRAAVASGENITYKLLFNGTVAMTGGQDPVGQMSLPQILASLQAERVAKIVVTSDEPSRTSALGLPKGVEVRHRDDMLDVQRELAEITGVTVLVHDQHCAAEKRRKRRRGNADSSQPNSQFTTPKQRVMINERICEGCGDCGAKSNCLSVHPVDTEFGRKTQIDQSSCNLDFSCLDGDCPAFVTVTPGTQRSRERVASIDAADVALPARASATSDFAVRVTGIGGTGVVTVSQVLATAATLGGLSARTVDMTGLAQKGGAVVSDIKVSSTPVEQAAKVASGDCDVYLACDQLVGADPVNLKVASTERTVAVVSTTKVPTGSMVIDTSTRFPEALAVRSAIDDHVARSVYLNAGELSDDLFDDEQYANMLMVGAAFQTGSLLLSAESIERAIELNGVAVDANLQAFRRGRQAVVSPDDVAAAVASVRTPAPTYSPSATAERAASSIVGSGDELSAVITRRYDELIAYQSEPYARTWLRTVRRVHDAGHGDDLTAAVARNLYKLMAYKDEYEVARLTDDTAFAATIADEFGDDAKVAVRLHPPMLREMGMKNKISLGAWADPALRGLAKMKRLRGTRLDPFGHAEVRRMERALIGEYRAAIDEVLAALGTYPSPERVAAATAIADLPDMVRGYESIKTANVARYRTEMRRQLDAL